MAVQVVAFSVQLGSRGYEIARGVARSLGFRYYDREIISSAAERAGVSPDTVASAERWPSFLERVLEHLGKASEVSDTGMAGGSVLAPPALTMTSADYRNLIEQVVTELAARGECVIVGHAGQVILRDHEDAFKVMVHGSLQQRAQLVAREGGISYDEAEKLIKADDKRRNDFFRHVYDIDVNDSSLYDLALNSDDLDDAMAVDLVIETINARA